MIIDLPPSVSELAPVRRFRPGRPLPVPVGRADLVRLSCTVGELPALATALSPSSPGGPLVHVDVDASDGAWPDAVVPTLVAGGVSGLDLAMPAVLTDATWVRLIGLLVTATEHGLPVRWTLPARPEWLEPGLLTHLAPPIGNTAAAADWRARHGFGQCYWRRGPGFVMVVDRRGNGRIRYTIHEPALLETFIALQKPCVIDGDVPADEVAELADAGLALCGGGLAIGLPYRLRRWPVPNDLDG